MPVLSAETVERMRVALAGVVSALYETDEGLDDDNVWTIEALDNIAHAVGREHTQCPHCGELRLFGDLATCRCAENRTD